MKQRDKERLVSIGNILLPVIASILIMLSIVTAITKVRADEDIVSASIKVKGGTDSISIDNTLLNESVGGYQADTSGDELESLIVLFNKYNQINDDVVAYLRIRNSNMSMPIAQQHTICSEHNTVDNCYYLYRDVYKRPAVNQTAIQFMEANNTVAQEIENFDQTTIVYGHTWNNNQRNGRELRVGDPNDKQFDQLVSYTDWDWFNEHKVLEFTTGTEITYWVPQYVVYTDAAKRNHPEGFNYSKLTLSEDDLRILYNRSVIANPEKVDVNGDKLLLLSTCNSKYESDGTNRLVVLFKYVNATSYDEALEIANSIEYKPHEIVVDWM